MNTLTGLLAAALVMLAAHPAVAQDKTLAIVVKGLDNPFFMGHAASGIESTLVFFQDALDWVATHTPDDRETVYLEAEVTWFKNRRGPFHRTMRSVRRELR